MDFDLSYHQLTNENLASNSLLEDDYSSGVEYKSILSKMLFEGADRKILRFSEPSPLRNPSTSPHSKRALQAVANCDQAELRQIYHENKAHSPYSRLQHRQISHTPEKILDAPDLLDDYYLNLLDWSSKDVLAVALGQTVYLWNAKTGAMSRARAVSAKRTAMPILWSASRWSTSFIAACSIRPNKSADADCRT